LVCARRRERAAPNLEELSRAQRRDQLYTGDEVLGQSYCVVSTMGSGHMQNKWERFARGSDARLNAYRGLLESRADI